MKGLLKKGRLLLIPVLLISIVAGWHFLVKSDLVPPLLDIEKIITLETEKGYWVGTEETMTEKGIFSIVRDWLKEKFSSKSGYELILPKDKPVKINEELFLTYKKADRKRVKLVDQNQGIHLLLRKRDHKNPFYGIVLEIKEIDEKEIRVKIYPKNNSRNPLSPPGA